MRARHGRLAAAATGTLLLAGVAARADLSTVDGVELAGALGFPPSALSRVMEGELVVRRATETSDKELALVVWGWTRRPVPLLFERLGPDDVLRVDRDVIAYAEIRVDDLEASFQALSLGDELVNELRGATSEGPVNLSHSELGALARSREAPETRDALERAYRRILADRTAAYLRGGMSAIAPYARGRSAVRPGAELRSATEGYRVLKKMVPEFHRAWAEFPKESASWDLVHRFFWIFQAVEGRPTVVLAHVMAGMRNGRALAAERQFYVGRSYNASETVWGGLPAETGSYVFYHNRTSTDQVAGIGGAVRKSIGRRMMQAQVLRFLERMRDALE